MSINNHPHQEQLSAYLDGMLDVAQMHQVAQHLDSCPACPTLLESLLETRTLLHSMPAPPSPSPEFWVNTFRHLRVESRQTSVSVGFWKRLQRQWPGVPRRWAAGVAAAAMIGAVILGPSLIHPAVLSSAPSPTISEDFVDMPSLVRAHTDSVAREPLADPDRQAMISADTDDLGLFNNASTQTAGDGDTVAADAAH